MARQSRSPLSYEYALLGFLSQQPMHAYEIQQRLRQTSGLRLVWTVKQGQLYALLARLEEEGYIASALEPQEGHPPRKMLSLTTQGEETLQRWLVEPVRRPRQFRQEFLAKLFLASQAGPATLRRLLESQVAANLRLLEDQQSQIDSAPLDQPYERLVYRWRAAQTEAHLRWLDECQQALLETTQELLP